MSQNLWSEVDEYFTERWAPSDPALDAAERDSEIAGLPPIQVTPIQGRLLELLARLQRARTILEIGTLGGYSTIWLGRALPADGRLITLEADARHAAVATTNIARAGLSEVAEVRVGRALEILPVLATEGHPPFDLVFIDADRPNNPEYLEWAVKLGRPGTLIVVDNVVRRGQVADETSEDPDVRGVREMIDRIAADRRLSATAVQTVGRKGYDGFALVLVVDVD